MIILAKIILFVFTVALFSVIIITPFMEYVP